MDLSFNNSSIQRSEVTSQSNAPIFLHEDRPVCLRDKSALEKAVLYFDSLDKGKGESFLSENMGLIKKGEDICKQLASGTMPAMHQHGHESIKAVMLYLKTQSILMGKESENEMHLVGGKELYEFLKEAGSNPLNNSSRTSIDSPITYYPAGKEHKSAFYSRTSSHYKDTVYKDQAGSKQQFGVDIDLWPGKKTILIGLRQQTRINDKGENEVVYSTFLKPEEHGCPPFWKKGFATWENFKNFIHHALGFVGTLKRQVGIEKWPINANTEKINPAEIAQLKTLGKKYYTAENKGTLRGDRKIELKKFEAELKTAKTSIHKLHQLTKKLLESAKDKNQVTELSELEQKFSRRYHSSSTKQISMLIQGNQESVHDLNNPVTNLVQ